MQYFANWSLHLRGAYELSNPCSNLLTTCLSQLSLCSTLTPVRLRTFGFKLNSRHNAFFQTLYFNSLLPVATVSADIVDRRVVATLQNERGGTQ